MKQKELTELLHGLYREAQICFDPNTEKAVVDIITVGVIGAASIGSGDPIGMQIAFHSAQEVLKDVAYLPSESILNRWDTLTQ